MPAFADARRAIHRGESDLPFVACGEGVSLQLLQVDLDRGSWVVRTRFAPGVTIATHKHTGPVIDAELVHATYRAMCASQGLSDSPVIVGAH
jgi:hypothetical protein